MARAITAPPPLRKVVNSEQGPHSQRIQMPDGAVAILCGPPARVDTLECGHVVTHYGPRRESRRCTECRAAQAATDEGRLF